MNPENMLDILKAASAESEETSDKIAQDFLSHSLTIDEFLEKFKKSRMEMHLRKLKVDKMQELLRHGAGNGPTQSQMNYPGGSNFYGNPSGMTPYPNAQGGYPNMPMMPMPPSFRSPF